MKILSTYKDYYDYLTGVWGEDPLLVLDRREFKIPYLNNSRDVSVYRFWIGNYSIECVCVEGKVYFGDSIVEILESELIPQNKIHLYHRPTIERHYKMSWEDLKKYKLYQIEDQWENKYILLKPFKHRPTDIIPDEVVVGMGKVVNRTVQFHCPYPILRDVGVNRVLPPETVYQWITEYLSEQKLKQEQHPDLRTDIQKIEGKGFDKRSSFRPNIKT